MFFWLSPRLIIHRWKGRQTQKAVDRAIDENAKKACEALFRVVNGLGLSPREDCTFRSPDNTSELVVVRLKDDVHSGHPIPAYNLALHGVETIQNVVTLQNDKLEICTIYAIFLQHGKVATFTRIIQDNQELEWPNEEWLENAPPGTLITPNQEVYELASKVNTWERHA